jgi:hypothetical protein
MKAMGNPLKDQPLSGPLVGMTDADAREHIKAKGEGPASSGHISETWHCRCRGR